MDKASRIERIGNTLQNIKTALQGKDLTEIPADILLKLQLKYEAELKAEYAEPAGAELDAEGEGLDKIIQALTDLYKKQASGAVTPAQAKARLSTLNSLLQAYNAKEAGSWVGLL